MFGLLVFHRMDLKPRTVQATKAVANQEGSIEEVVCKVDFDEVSHVIPITILLQVFGIPIKMLTTSLLLSHRVEA
jgi:hypothetical protein